MMEGRQSHPVDRVARESIHPGAVWAGPLRGIIVGPHGDIADAARVGLGGGLAVGPALPNCLIHHPAVRLVREDIKDVVVGAIVAAVFVSVIKVGADQLPVPGSGGNIRGDEIYLVGLETRVPDHRGVGGHRHALGGQRSYCLLGEGSAGWQRFGPRSTRRGRDQDEAEE